MAIIDYVPFDPGRSILQGLALGEARRDRQRERERQDVARNTQALGVLGQMLEGIDPGQRQSVYQSGIQFLGNQGFDVSDFPEAIDDDTFNQLLTAKNLAFQKQLTTVPAGIKDRQDLLSKLPVNPDGSLKDISQMSAQDRAIAIEAGLLPRATGSGAITTAMTPGLTGQVASSQAQIEGDKAAAKEASKLKAQYKLKPQVEAAVRTAIADVNTAAKISEENRSNSRTLDIYQTGIGGLASALSGTDTGPFLGWSPALTSNQQIADGAIAAMAPILKAMFRADGEGAFSDKDQELLIAMIPTRKDTQEAREAKLRNIDAIVRAKLGPSSSTSGQQEPAQTAQQAQETFTTKSGITFTVK